MISNEEMMKNILAIYKYAFENPNVHRNVMRKNLLNKGKISSKEKFSKTLESLIALGKLTLNGENVSINSSIVSLGVLQRDGNDYYVVTPNSNKHLKIDRSVASGYSMGDLLDIVVEYSGRNRQVLVLGKSKKDKDSQIPSEKENKDSYANLSQNQVLGRVVKLNHDELVFIPNRKNISLRQIQILNRKEEWSKFQDKICIMSLVDESAPALGGVIVAVKGDAGNPIHEYDAIAESYGAIMSWDDDLQLKREIEQIPTTVDLDSLNLISEAEARLNHRGNIVDLRHIPFVTIDPATCKDMDDAIYSTFNENGDIVCYTAVANVTKYVDLNSEIGKRYLQGVFTIYAPNKAYSVLPSKLSTGICSLNPNEDRLAFVVKTVIDKNTGKVKDSGIFDAVIKSRQKYSYEQAQEMVDLFDSEQMARVVQYKCLTGEPLLEEEQILMNFYAGQLIKYGFDQRKMIRFVSNKEREIVFDSDLKDVVDIKTIPHLYYHEVIEAFMVSANEVTAKYARDKNIDNIYRVHDEPNPRKVDKANEFFDVLGIEFEGDLSAQGTRTLIDLIRDTANEEVINNFLIKMQSRAIYSDHLYSDKKNDNPQDWAGERISHYALQSPHYSHSTAPIRRALDYFTHYNILADIHGTRPISANRIQAIIENANQRQIEIDQAEKDFDDISSVIYCEKHIGETMSGRISKIRSASIEEGYEDEIIVIVKNEEKGISAEIPLSQILGRPSYDCSLSEQRCAVYDGRGNIVLTLCKPIEFIIEKADRKKMIVVGKTNKEMVRNAEQKLYGGRQRYNKSQLANFGSMHQRQKDDREKRIENNKEYGK